MTVLFYFESHFIAEIIFWGRNHIFKKHFCWSVKKILVDIEDLGIALLLHMYSRIWFLKWKKVNKTSTIKYHFF